MTTPDDDDETETNIDSSDVPLNQRIGVQDFEGEESDSDNEFLFGEMLIQMVIGGDVCSRLKYTNFDMIDNRWYPRMDVGHVLADGWCGRQPKIENIRFGY